MQKTLASFSSSQAPQVAQAPGSTSIATKVPPQDAPPQASAIPQHMNAQPPSRGGTPTYPQPQAPGFSTNQYPSSAPGLAYGAPPPSQPPGLSTIPPPAKPVAAALPAALAAIPEEQKVSYSHSITVRVIDFYLGCSRL